MVLDQNSNVGLKILSNSKLLSNSNSFSPLIKYLRCGGHSVYSGDAKISSASFCLRILRPPRRSSAYLTELSASKFTFIIACILLHFLKLKIVRAKYRFIDMKTNDDKCFIYNRYEQQVQLNNLLCSGRVRALSFQSY